MYLLTVSKHSRATSYDAHIQGHPPFCAQADRREGTRIRTRPIFGLSRLVDNFLTPITNQNRESHFIHSVLRTFTRLYCRFPLNGK